MEWKKTYELIQQTPIIHFQHDQSGATLRATEVKPKLDKFIIKKMGGSVPEEWFIKDTKALNYKIQITTSGTPKKSETIETTLKLKEEKEMQSQSGGRSERQRNLESKLRKEINEMYFANMVSNNERDYEEAVRKTYKETLFFNTPIKLTVVCFIEDLQKTISEYIEEFFFVHNFGTRQSKGFGGFIVDRKDNKEDPIKVLSEQGYRFFYAEVIGNPTYETMLNHAKNVYAVMKGGYNHTGWVWDRENKRGRYKYPKRYIKGYIQRQFIEDFFGDKVVSDKVLIKSKRKYSEKFYRDYNGVYPIERKGKSSDYSYNDYLFVRALLGLADHYEFGDDIFGPRNKHVEIFSLGNKDFCVERFKSPITIKVIKNKLIFIVGDFNDICNKEFYLSPNGVPGKSNFDRMSYEEKKSFITTNEKVFIKIETPKSFSDVDVIKFINKFVAYFNEKKENFINFGNKNNGQYFETPISISGNIRLNIPNHLKEV